MFTWKNKSVLIAGGAGFIGSNLAIRLVKGGARVLALDSLVPGLGGNLFNLSPIRDSVRFEQVDLRDLERIERFVRETDFVFNFAGNVSHLDSMTNPMFDMAINVESSVTLLEACRRVNPQVPILFASTRQIYGPPKYLPVDEKHPINPVDVNGINKFAAENYYSLYSKVYGMKTVALRLTNTYGPRQLIRHSRQGFIGWFLNRVTNNQPIELFGGGTQERDFTFVDDVVDASLKALSTPRCFGEVYNLNGERQSLESLAQELITLNGRGSIEKIPFPAEKKRIDIGNYVGDSSKFESHAGWSAKVSLREGLSQTLDYYKENARHYLDAP